MPRNLDRTYVSVDPRDPGYSPDELELLKAVDEFKRRTGVKFPSVTEVLRIAESIGWSRARRYHGEE